MTTRGQNLRSSTPGNMPAAGTRQPGELWMTFPDLQLGYIDASKNPQRVIAVRFFSTAANYAIGDFVVQAGQLYRAVAASTAGAFKPGNWAAIGGSVSVGDAPPTSPQAGTLWWDSVGGQLYVWFTDADSSQWVVANNVSGAQGPAGAVGATGATGAQGPAGPTSYNVNRIDNGDMAIDQHNLGVAAPVPANGFLYGPDRFYGQNSQGTSRFKMGQNLAAIAAKPAGFKYFLGAQSTSAYTPAAAAVLLVGHAIEGDVIADLGFGAAGASPVTVSFWVISSLTGNFSFSMNSGNYAVGSSGGVRCYVTTYNIPTANTWTKITITIPGDVASPNAWPVGGALGVTIFWDLGSGATGQTATLNSWLTGAVFAATGAVQDRRAHV